MAAVTATLAAALLRMSGSIGLRHSPDEELATAVEEIKHCEDLLAARADQDIRSFNLYLAARKNKRAEKEPDVQRLLLVCAKVPLEAAELVEHLQLLAVRIVAKCPDFLASDIATARYLLEASHRALLENVVINLGDLDESNDKHAIVERLERLRNKYTSIKTD